MAALQSHCDWKVPLGRCTVKRTRMSLPIADEKFAEQPTLIINDMKVGAARGALALWIGLGTEGYFSDMVVRSAP